jgi:hypothetical protein
MLADFLEQRGFSVVLLNGSMDLEERRQAQRHFAGGAQILISTDAGGEGLNLQFCHVIVNYDLPWNPMKVEQRIGRVDRIGQKYIVRALNFALEGTVELRVREVLEEKLQLILEEFGVDKLADVLDSEEGGVPFEELFAQAIVAPEEAERRASALADEIRRRTEEARAGSRLLNAAERLDPSEAQKIANHRMPYWTERLTLGFLRSQEDAGDSVKPAAVGYDLRWPNGEACQGAVFSRDDADRPGATLISLEDERVRGLTTNLPVFAPGQPIPSIIVPNVSDKTSGIWSLWRISLHTAEGREQRFHALFLTEGGRVFGPTARTIWDRLIDLPGGLKHANGTFWRPCRSMPMRQIARLRKRSAPQSSRSWRLPTSSALSASARKERTHSHPVVGRLNGWVCSRFGLTASASWLRKSRSGPWSLLRGKQRSRI